MEVLEWKRSMIKMKNSLEWLNSRFEVAKKRKKISELKTGPIEIIQSEREKIWVRMSRITETYGQHQVYQLMYSSRERRG